MRDSLRKSFIVFVMMTMVLSYNIPIVLAAGEFGGHSTLTNNLVSYWSFDSDATDDHASHDGTADGATHGSSSGILSGAYSFDGDNDYISVSDHADLNISGTVSIAAWVKRSRLGVDFILEKGGDWYWDNLNYGLALHNVNNNMMYFTYGGGYYSCDGISDTTNWHHVVAIATDGAQDVTFYIDGVEKTATHRDGSSTVNLNTNNTAPLHIGAQLGYSFYDYYGANNIDEIGIWDRALTLQEVTDLYNSSAGLSYAASAPAGVPEFNTIMYLLTISAAGWLIFKKMEDLQLNNFSH